MRRLCGIVFGLCALTQAHAADHPQADRQALDLAKQAIALRSVAGPGDQTPQVAQLFRKTLLAGGFSSDDITIVPKGNTVWMTARWPGQDPNAKPLVVLGHMDVVEARRADWTRDPFGPVVEHGYLFGRGATDMKLDDTIAIASLLDLKRQGFKPARDIIFAFSGDEETAMRTGEAMAQTLKNAEMVLNVDGASGVLDDQTGKPLYFSWSGAEKTYADFTLGVTNPGGHSSEPRPINAIDQMAKALLAVEQHRFKPEVNALTRAYFENAAAFAPEGEAVAMRAFATDLNDAQAVAVLRADPAMVGRIGTTCVATMIDGGHAVNALPQRVTANVNCRIFPGHTRGAIMEELSHAIADSRITVSDSTLGSVATDASPVRADFANAIETAVHAAYPGLPIVPSMDSGASDSMWFRALGVPSYGISPIFIKPSEDFMHGLNERTPVASIAPAVTIMESVVTSLAR